MAGGGKQDDDEVISAINVTPLVDITLVLLIIFMVTAKIMVSTSIPIDLPKAASGGDQQVVFAIAIAKDGNVFVDKAALSGATEAERDAKLQAMAKTALAKDKDLRTVIQASKDVSHGVVMHVLDELRQAGVTKIGFAIDKTVSATGVTTTPAE